MSVHRELNVRQKSRDMNDRVTYPYLSSGKSFTTLRVASLPYLAESVPARSVPTQHCGVGYQLLPAHSPHHFSTMPPLTPIPLDTIPAGMTIIQLGEGLP